MGDARLGKQGEPAPLEAEIQRDILLAAPSVGCRLLRNNIGTLKDATGRHVSYGVGGAGGSDLIGWTVVDGRAVFTAIEVKRKGKKATDEQVAFVAAVQAAGGIGAVCYSVDEFRAAVQAYGDR
jgi:hypothetical protein